jgi:hypothetical protein
MARFYGKVGFVTTQESKTNPGVWVEVATEREYYGDVVRNYRKWENGKSINDNIVLNNSISIVGDEYAHSNLFAIKYVEWAGKTWKVESIEIQSPRLLLSLGGVYNRGN